MYLSIKNKVHFYFILSIHQLTHQQKEERKIMLLRNKDLRKAKGNIPAWAIGEKLGIHENSVFRLLRTELAPEKKTEFLSAIEEVKKDIEKEKKGIK